MNKALNENYIAMDERSMLDLVQFTLKYSRFVNFYSLQNNVIDNWESFLLHDSAFIIAMIASTNTNKYKINFDNSELRSDEKKEMEILDNSINSIVELVTHWSTLLSKSNYDGSLSKEINKLLQSVNIRNALNKNKNIWESREFYNSLYGNIVFVKEKAIRNFEKEILSHKNHHPHIGLLLAFFKLFQNVQQDINSLTKKHLDFYYKNLLQQKRKKVEQATAILGVQLAGGTEELLINEGDVCEFSFGENQQYNFTAEGTTRINKTEIVAIKTLYKSESRPFSNNFETDGFPVNYLYENTILSENTQNDETIQQTEYPATLGEKQGYNQGEESNIKLSDAGLLISSPALLLEKGKQEIRLIFKITSGSYDRVEAMFEGLVNREIAQGNWKESDNDKLKTIIRNKFTRDAFDIFITDTDAWKKVEHVVARINVSDQTLYFDIKLNWQEDSLVPFNPEIHKGGYDTEWPCIKLLLNNNIQYQAYGVFKAFVVEYISIKASVSEVNNYSLSNSTGNVDNTIPFAPFGPAPFVGSFLRLQNPLILQNNLTELELSWNWSGLPKSKNGFADYYRAYPGEINNKSFKAFIAPNKNILNASENQENQEIDMFDTEDGYLLENKKIKIDLGNFNFKNQIDLKQTGDEKNVNQLFIVLTNPKSAFGHPDFANIYAEAALLSSKFKRKQVKLPNQPYTPVIDQLNLCYTNSAKEVMLRKQDNNDSDIKVVHIYPFGQVQVFPGSIKSESFLLPQINHKGNLFLGLKHAEPGIDLSIGFDMVPAVYLHSVIKKPSICWEYLSNNEWVAFGDLLLEDSTDGLIKSGIVTLKMPQTIQYNNTLLPKGKFWIRAVSNGSEDLNSKIKNVFTQAVKVVENNLDVDSDVAFDSATVVDKIRFVGKKGVGKISGPFHLEMHNSIETEDAYYARVSEQLRHKNRVVSNWDVERIILNRFTTIDKVRVYGRNSHPKELVKGSSLQIVVIPKNIFANGERKGSNKLDFNTLHKVKKYISNFLSPYVHVEVSNPVYEQLKVRCTVAFTDIQKRGYWRKKLNDELITYLSPDIENASLEKGFDESISKTEILNFIESRTYVDFVSEFSVLQLVEVQGRYKILDTAKLEKIKALRTISPYAILTSAPEHQIEIIPDKIPTLPKVSGIGDLSIESDFIISDGKGNYN